MEENEALKEYLQREEQKEIEQALLAPWPEDHHVQARLEQLNEQVRNLVDSQKATHPAQQERLNYLTKVGEFDALVMLSQFGFSTAPSPALANHKSKLATLKQDGLEIRLLTDANIEPGSNAVVQVIRNGERQSLPINLPTNPDQVYDLLDKIGLQVPVFPANRAQYESTYVKQMKQQPKPKK